MVGTLIIEYYLRNKSYTIPDITDDSVLAKQRRRYWNFIDNTQFQDEQHEVTDKDITETCDIAAKFKLFKEFQVCVEKKLSELEAAIVPGYNGQTPPQNNISGNFLTSISVNFLSR